MIVSDARRAANRRNAQQSTGPVTDEGKAVARRNAVKHGLTALVVAAGDGDGGEGRADGFARSLRPENEWQAWVVEAIALATTRLDRAEQLERQARAEASWRAASSWEEDQKRDAERLGARLARDPNRVVAELRRTPAGCDWLIDRWAMLAGSTGEHRRWTPEQAELAFDLLGTPAALRQGRPGDRIDAEGRPADAAEPDLHLARGMVAELEALRARVVEADEVARALVEAGRADNQDPGLARLRRYERELQSRLRWLVEQFHAGASARLGPRVPAPPKPVELAAPPRNEPISAPAPAETKPLEPAAPPRNEPIPAAPPSPPEPTPWLESSPIGGPDDFLAHLDPTGLVRARSAPARRRPDPRKLVARARG